MWGVLFFFLRDAEPERFDCKAKIKRLDELTSGYGKHQCSWIIIEWQEI
jgi:hypothetical protein